MEVGYDLRQTARWLAPALRAATGQRKKVMNRSLILVGLVTVLGFGDQLIAVPCDEISFDEVIFREDFNGPDGTRVDANDWEGSNEWIIGHPGWCWFVHGRSFIPTPDCLPDAPVEHYPHLQGNACVVRHYAYNPYDIDPDDPDDPDHVRTTFLGGEFYSAVEFDPTRCYCFEASVRWPDLPEVPGGLVASFFTYGYDGANSDEIDFEYLSNEVFDPSYVVRTNVYDDSVAEAAPIPIPTLNLGDWNVFRIYWCPDTCVEWVWVDPGTGDEVSLRTEASLVPDESMALWFNLWAAHDGWQEAYNPGLQPDQEDNEVFYEYLIDYIEVRVVPEPASCLIVSLGGLCLLARRRNRHPVNGSHLCTITSR
jgi:hypothetical protein